MQNPALIATVNTPSATERRFLRRREVERRTGLKRSYIYQLIRRQQFPKPIPLGPRAVGWDSQEVERWMDGRRRAAGRAD